MNDMTSLLPQAFAGVLTTSDAARELNLSQDRVTRLLEQGELVGLRQANRWFLTPAAIAAFRRRRYGATQDLALRALAAEGVRLTPKQRAICDALKDGTSMTAASRVTELPRPSLYAQLRLIQRKLDKQSTSPSNIHPLPPQPDPSL
jgi:helix-turn-helix protein